MSERDDEPFERKRARCAREVFRSMQMVSDHPAQKTHIVMGVERDGVACWLCEVIRGEQEQVS